MVDFQSRDTRRGRDDGDDTPDEEAEPAGTDESADVDGSDDRADAEGSTSEATPERGVAVVSVSGDRTIEDDAAGEAVVAEVDAAGGTVVTRELIAASYDGVQKTIGSLVNRRDVYGIVTTGGTGVEPDDVTIEAIRPMFDKELPGFGELLRRSCYEEVGSAAIRTRATAGVVDGVVCFCLPGDAEVVTTGVREFVVPEAEYLAALAAEPES